MSSGIHGIPKNLVASIGSLDYLEFNYPSCHGEVMCYVHFPFKHVSQPFLLLKNRPLFFVE